MFVRLLFLLACLGLLPAAPAADPAAAVTVPMKLVKLGPHSYFVQGQSGAASSENQGFMSNAGFVVTQDGVVVFDTLASPPLAEKLLGLIRGVTKQPIRRVIVSHYHADHFYGLQVFKATGLIKRVSPGKVSQFRRWQWPSADDALKHYAAKSIFARWDPAVLRDYIACGVEPDPDHGGVRLAFRREVETRFYNTLPHHLSSVLRRHPPQCPVAFIGGTQSVEMRQVGMAATRRVCKERITMLEGTHLFPMEKPAATAAAVLRALG